MANVTLTSGLISDINSSPAVKHNQIDFGGKEHEIVGVIAVGTNNTVGDIWTAVRVRSSDRLSQLFVTNDKIDTNATPTLAVSLGVYQTAANGGAAVAATQFLSAAAFGHSAAGPTDDANLTAAQMNQALWQVLGLSSDPGVDYDISFKVTTAAATAAAGNVSVKAVVVRV